MRIQKNCYEEKARLLGVSLGGHHQKKWVATPSPETRKSAVLSLVGVGGYLSN
jgi:hypothetical protein